MASIVKEKSMGRPVQGRTVSSKHISGRKSFRLFSNLWLKYQFINFKLVSYRTASLAALVIFSALFLIYCRTSSHSLHESPAAVENTEAVVQTPMEQENPPEIIEKKEELPDLSALNMLGNMDYDPGRLRGVFWREKDFQGRYYLTFDDGPNRQAVSENSGLSVSESILNSLADFDYKAVFFINGKNLVYKDEEEKSEIRALLYRFIREGHLLGNHSYSHHNLARGIFADGEHDRSDIEDELQRTQTALNDILGFSYPLLLVRPPYAEPGRSDTLDGILKDEGLFLVSLQFDSYDYAFKEDGRWNSLTIGTRVMSLMEEQSEGGVLLLHELDSTARMLPGLLENMKQQEFSIGKLEEHLYKKYGRES